MIHKVEIKRRVTETTRANHFTWIGHPSCRLGPWIEDQINRYLWVKKASVKQFRPPVRRAYEAGRVDLAAEGEQRQGKRGRLC